MSVSLTLLRAPALVIILLLLTSCASNLTVEGNFPSPLVKQLPYNVAVFYDQDFSEYSYVEQSENRTEWTINIGSAQVALFNTILPSLFTQVVQLQSLQVPLAQPNVDLIIQPILTDFQYNVPRETKVEMYEVWMKYNVRVLEPDGELVADWIMSAYGKTPSGFIKSSESALNDAMNVALRDAGANLSLTFVHVPEIKAWMSRQQATRL